MSIQILTGDCRQTLATLPEKSVQCCVTSPPYFGLRDYNVTGQIGLEPTPDEYVREMVAVFSAVRRVLKDDGVLWLNLGDSYSRNPKKGGSFPNGKHDSIPDYGAARKILAENATTGSSDGAVGRGDRPGSRSGDLPDKNLLMIPARVAMSLQADGWYLRAACPWIKRNGMPDSTQDRPTQCVETVFMLTKSRSCYYDSEAVKVACSADMKRRAAAGYTRGAGGKIDASRCDADSIRGEHAKAIDGTTRLRRTSDWFFESWQGLLLDSEDEPSAFVVNLKGYKEAHFATFPPKLVEPCILAATSEKGECPKCGKAWERVVDKTAMVIDRSERTHELGRTRSSGTMVEPAKSCTTGWRAQCQCGCPPIPQTVIDPFGGSGTTAEVARQHGRSAILCELNEDYVRLMHKRLGITPTIEPLCLDE